MPKIPIVSEIIEHFGEPYARLAPPPRYAWSSWSLGEGKQHSDRSKEEAEEHAKGRVKDSGGRQSEGGKKSSWRSALGKMGLSGFK